MHLTFAELIVCIAAATNLVHVIDFVFESAFDVACTACLFDAKKLNRLKTFGHNLRIRLYVRIFLYRVDLHEKCLTIYDKVFFLLFPTTIFGVNVTDRANRRKQPIVAKTFFTHTISTIE